MYKVRNKLLNDLREVVNRGDDYSILTTPYLPALTKEVVLPIAFTAVILGQAEWANNISIISHEPKLFTEGVNEALELVCTHLGRKIHVSKPIYSFHPSEMDLEGIKWSHFIVVDRLNPMIFPRLAMTGAKIICIEPGGASKPSWEDGGNVKSLEKMDFLMASLELKKF